MYTAPITCSKYTAMCVRDSLNTEGTRRKSDRVDANVAGVCGRVEHNPRVDVREGEMK